MKNFVIYILFLSPLVLFSQKFDKNKKYLHLVMAYEQSGSVHNLEEKKNVYDPFSKEGYYYRILWRLEGDTLAVVDTLNFAPQLSTTQFGLYHFSKQKWFIYSERVLDTRKNIFKYGKGRDDFPAVHSVLDYNGDSLVLRRIDRKKSFNFKKSELYVLGLLKIGDKIVVICPMDRTKTAYSRFAIDRFFNRYDLEIKDFQHIVDYGQPSPFHNAYNKAFTFDENGVLRIGISLYPDRRVKLEDKQKALLQVPESMKTDSAYLNILINMPECNYLVTKPSCWKNDCSTTTLDLKNQLWIQNKSTKIWRKLTLPFQWPAMGSYKNWLYGTRVYWKKGKENQYYNDDELGRMRRDLFYKENKLDKKRYSGKYGNPTPLFAGLTGDLYLYHIPSKKQIHWNTSDLDSELITIEKSWIYYRVFDELRRVPLDEIRNEIIWDKEELLIKNRDIIPHVHHIFWHKKSEMKIEWLTPKPEYAK